MVSAQQSVKHNDPPSPGARRKNFDVKTTSNFNIYIGIKTCI